MNRPLIAVPARFSVTASALRHRAEVTAAALAEAVFAAGGEPVTLHPHAPDGRADLAATAYRLARFDGVVLPGGGDIAPHRYGQRTAHPSVYDVHDEQDGFDLAVAHCALRDGIPLLAVCRGLHVVNTALGGTLEQDMGGPGRDHRHRTHTVALDGGSLVAATMGRTAAEVSCFHHQRVDRLGRGLVAGATADDGTIEAVERTAPGGFLLAVQWHPEDGAHRDPAQQALFSALIAAAARASAGGDVPPQISATQTLRHGDAPPYHLTPNVSMISAAPRPPGPRTTEGGRRS